MASKAPLHLQRHYLSDQRHMIHAPVTRRASHAFVYMNAVIEIREVGDLVYTRPADRVAGTEAVAHGSQIRAVPKNFRMAVHAGLNGRNSRKGRSLDRCVAIAAID